MIADTLIQVQLETLEILGEMEVMVNQVRPVDRDEMVKMVDLDLPVEKVALVDLNRVLQDQTVIPVHLVQKVHLVDKDLMDQTVNQANEDDQEKMEILEDLVNQELLVDQVCPVYLD